MVNVYGSQPLRADVHHVTTVDDTYIALGCIESMTPTALTMAIDEAADSLHAPRAQESNGLAERELQDLAVNAGAATSISSG